MIGDTIAFLRPRMEEVLFDAEHFFDGFRANRDYALATLKAAEAAGAHWLVLCDTNGGTLPAELVEIIRAVKRTCGRRSASTCTTTPSAPWRTRSPRSPRASVRCRARSTASASAAATRTSCRSSRASC